MTRSVRCSAPPAARRALCNHSCCRRRFGISANSKLSTAIHALCWLELSARRGRPTLTSEEVARSLASHPVLVRRSLAPLRDAGLVISRRGPGAGWSLGRPAQAITLLEVYQAVADDDTFALHAHEPNLECPVGFGIRPVLSDVYTDVRAAMTEQLRGRTIATVLETVLAEHPLP